ncbi:putative F-box protein At1g32420 [Papaver somniferum]|uniref:putative F-box protein At1g32420 n=1 Tax=Papaver somniferum TaxID=3469 RepID=UPI000E6F82B5|nr:putative F-box protein At1g32420 [Papaver somniferum]
MASSKTRKQKKSRSGHVSIGVDLVCDILSRLPVKTLLRFKCVSKQWLSLIQHDSYFIDLHHARSKSRPCFLFAMAVPQDSDIWNYYHTNETSVVPRIFNRTTVVGFDPSFFVRYLKPVNGLLCVIEFIGIKIYNITTRKSTPLIVTTDHLLRRPVYQFGFDPATKEHKVICIWTSYGEQHKQGSACLGCQVLTVGENSTWRMIDEGVPDNYHIKEDASVYANGSIYWITAEFMNSLNSEEKVIVAFHVGHEKFRKIIVPQFATLDYDLHNPAIKLLEVNDRLALLYRLHGGSTVKLWILDGTGDEGKKYISTGDIGSCIHSRTELTINLPFQWGITRCVEFLPIPGTEEILMESYERHGPGVRFKRNPFFSLHSYNWKSMTLKEESVERHTSIPVLRHEKRIKFVSSAYFESLFPVMRK